MIDQLPTLAFPEWLADLSPTVIENGTFPLLELLGDSLYYPSSGFDGDPVRYLAGNILSFVYVDYGHDRKEFMDVLQNPGFRGYDLLATRSVTEQELVPRGWRPAPPTPDDGDPSRHREWIKSPFCIWSVFSRGEAFPVDRGPRRFSLLYLCADGVAAFQALYVGTPWRPKPWPSSSLAPVLVETGRISRILTRYLRDLFVRIRRDSLKSCSMEVSGRASSIISHVGLITGRVCASSTRVAAAESVYTLRDD